MGQLHKSRRIPQAQVALIGQGGVNHLDDAPGARRHHHNFGGQIDRFRNAVGHKHHGAPLALPELLQLFVEPVAGDLVERTKGLVHHQNLGLEGQRPRNRHALLHATRELPRVFALKAFETHALQVLEGNGFGLGPAFALDLKRQGHVGQHIAPREQRGCLEHITIGTGQPGVMRAHTIDQHLAGADVLQVCNHPHQRGFATTGRADQGDKLAFTYIQIDVG